MFVLLEHDTGQGVHWDFMVELPGQDKLATWRLARNPLDAPNGVPAERIGGHRRAYLDYEGDLGGGRGRVRRLDRGAATVETAATEEIIFNLAGTQLRGAYKIALNKNNVFTFHRVS